MSGNGHTSKMSSMVENDDDERYDWLLNSEH